MTEGKGPKYIGRPFRNGDEYGIVEVYNAVTGRSRTTEQHRWEWLDAPAGPGSIWVIETSDTKEIVGHHGLRPLQCSYFGLSILAGATENTVIHPQQRGKLLYFPFEKRFFEEAKSRFDLLVTTEGRGVPGRIRKQLGYIPVGGYVTYFRVTKKSYLDKLVGRILDREINNGLIRMIAKQLSKLANYLVMLAFVSHRPVDNEIRLEEVDDIASVDTELDMLWDRNKGKFGVTIARDSRFLKWRIFDNPNLDENFIVARKSQRIVGYVVWNMRREGQATIVDLVADSDDSKTIDTIINKTLRMLMDKGIFVFTFATLRSNNALNMALKRNSFRSFYSLRKQLNKINREEEPVLLAKTINDELDPIQVSSPEYWYFTDLFSEGLESEAG